MTIGSNIKKLRTGKKLTQDQLAEKLYVTRQTVSNWERGTSQPDLEQLEAIAGALEVDVTTLLYGPKPKFRISRKQVAIAAVLLILAAALWTGAMFWFEPKIKTWCFRAYNLSGWYLYRCLYLAAAVLTTVIGFMTLLKGLAPMKLEARSRRGCLTVGLAFGLIWLLGSGGLLARVLLGWSPPWYELFRALLYIDDKNLHLIAAAVSGIFLFLAFNPSRKQTPEN